MRNIEKCLLTELDSIARIDALKYSFFRKKNFYVSEILRRGLQRCPKLTEPEKKRIMIFRSTRFSFQVEKFPIIFLVQKIFF